jgi:hypothetical protein
VTYTQLRRHLATVARYDAGAPTSVLDDDVRRELEDAGCVTNDGDRWTVTRLGLTILSHRAPVRPYARPWRRDQNQQARSA